MTYISCEFKLEPFYPFNEMLVAELSELGFESFTEEDNVLAAFIEKKKFNEKDLELVLALKNKELSYSLNIIEIQKENWNQKWETSFEPVEVGKFCIIRAPFHAEKKGFKHELIIEPKMSFGTGHHATTQMVIEAMEKLQIAGKSVLDMGSGTGVLAILADQLGASQTIAIDIEEWAFENIQENITRNQAKNVKPFLGDVSLLQEINQTYDLVLANINKNILLKDLPQYRRFMKQGGDLVLSGFFIYDTQEIQLKVEELGLSLKNSYHQNDWCALHFVNSKSVA